MRDDVLIDEVLDKCGALKRSSLWVSEPHIRPRAWLNNFDSEDRAAAATLLDHFTFYDSKATDALLVAAYRTLGDGMPKGSGGLSSSQLASALSAAVFTPVRGEHPNPTDSGNFLSRKVRQHLGVPEERIVETNEALASARRGTPVVFVDDFIGSGDQFISTWTMAPAGTSFAREQARTGFIAIYVVLVATQTGIQRIHRDAPHVVISPTHVLEGRSTLQGIYAGRNDMEIKVEALLDKYISRLTPSEEFIANNPRYLKYGFKEKGLMLAFEHSIPDSTLPIFWSPGTNAWSPLIERT